MWHWQSIDDKVTLPAVPNGGHRDFAKRYDLCLTGEVSIGLYCWTSTNLVISTFATNLETLIGRYVYFCMHENSNDNLVFHTGSVVS